MSFISLISSLCPPWVIPQSRQQLPAVTDMTRIFTSDVFFPSTLPLPLLFWSLRMTHSTLFSELSVILQIIRYRIWSPARWLIHQPTKTLLVSIFVLVSSLIAKSTWRFSAKIEFIPFHVKSTCASFFPLWPIFSLKNFYPTNFMVHPFISKFFSFPNMDCTTNKSVSRLRFTSSTEKKAIKQSEEVVSQNLFPFMKLIMQIGSNSFPFVCRILQLPIYSQFSSHSPSLLINYINQQKILK